MKSGILDTNDVRAVVFDLDGTLYPGTAIIDSYIGCVLEHIDDPTVGETVFRETQAIITGVHPVIPFGSFARGQLGTDDFELVVDDTVLRETLGRDWFYLGDAWTVVYYLLQGREIPHELFVRAFHQTRYALSEGKLGYVPSPRLGDALEHLRRNGIHTVMQTNSEEESGWETLEFLGVEASFSQYIFRAGKPTGMEDLFRRLSEEMDIPPESIVSIGDHPWNDFVSAEKIGGRPLLISPFSGFPRDRFLPRVDTVDELIDTLYSMTAPQYLSAVGE